MAAPAGATIDRVGRFPPPAPFVPSFDIDEITWIDEHLQPWGRVEGGVLVGELVPSGFEAYARIFHPGRRFFARDPEQSVPLRWSEVAEARGKTVHPEMQIEALIDSPDGFDYDHWRAISSGGGEWFPPYETLEATECLALAFILGAFTASPIDAWFMLWDGYGDLGPAIDAVPRGMIHPDRSGNPLPPELVAHTPALRHYLVFRAPLDGLAEWFRWSGDAPNYWWPSDRSWIVVTEIDGFTTYVGGTRECVDEVLASPFLEGLPSSLEHRFDVRGDTVNGWPGTSDEGR